MKVDHNGLQLGSNVSAVSLQVKVSECQYRGREKCAFFKGTHR